MAWFREGRRRGRLEVLHVKLVEGRALLLGELDEAVLARAAAAGAARALARALVVRPLVVGQALGPGARRAAALALGHLLAGQARLRRRLLLVLLHVAPAVRVDADGQHECFVAFDALVALDLVLGFGGDGDVRRHLDRRARGGFAERRPARGGRMGCRNVLYGSAARARAGVAPFLRLAPTARQCFARARCANARFSAERPSIWLCDSIAVRIGRCGDLYVKISALKKAALRRQNARASLF